MLGNRVKDILKESEEVEINQLNKLIANESSTRKVGLYEKRINQLLDQATDRFVIIKKEIDKWDPVSLFELGAPDDEYEDEIIAITLAFDEQMSCHDLAYVIKDVFDKMFSTSFDYNACFKVADKILNGINN